MKRSRQSANAFQLRREATADPVADYRGSAEYRRAMAGVRVRRAVEAAGGSVAV
ncbi:MAG: hypothetical protein RMK99_11380 [Anaerolineales bacterium]|nr:hypothetical protein [Anaerolineales bacterium]